MVHAKILLQGSSKQTNWVKTFNSLDSFNKYKESKLEHCTLIKYSLRNDNEKMYSSLITEYGVERTASSRVQRDTYKNATVNSIQKDSLNNHLAVKGNKIISLVMTSAKVKSLSKLIDTAPLTSKEVSILKSMFSMSKLSASQYELIENIKHKASRRVKL